MYNKTYERKLYRMKEIISSVLSLLLILVILWFNYSIANIFVTIYKCKKVDNSLRFCFNTLGKFFFLILIIVYIASVIGGLTSIIYGLINNAKSFWEIGIQVFAFVSVITAYFLSSLVLVGKKYMMVGRMMIDYRKLKKVNFGFDKKMSFVYAQNEYHFSTRFIDVTSLRKKIAQ